MFEKKHQTLLEKKREKHQMVDTFRPALYSKYKKYLNIKSKVKSQMHESENAKTERPLTAQRVQSTLLSGLNHLSKIDKVNKLGASNQSLLLEYHKYYDNATEEVPREGAHTARLNYSNDLTRDHLSTNIVTDPNEMSFQGPQ